MNDVGGMTIKVYKAILSTICHSFKKSIPNITATMVLCIHTPLPQDVISPEIDLLVVTLVLSLNINIHCKSLDLTIHCPESYLLVP